MRLTVGIKLIAAALVSCSLAAGSLPLGKVPVPAVGCASNGQLGPRAAPSAPDKRVAISAGLSRRLAWYFTADGGVLAPRGWRCFGIAGSDGVMLVVTPEPHGVDLMRGGTRITGDAVVSEISYGGTSGRFTVADVAAGLFPTAAAFTDAVRQEGIVPIEPVLPGAGDHILSRTIRRVDYRTLPFRDGLGTRRLLKPSRHAVRGAYSIGTDSEPDLVSVRARLPADDAWLAEAIVAS